MVEIGGGDEVVAPGSDSIPTGDRALQKLLEG